MYIPAGVILYVTHLTNCNELNLAREDDNRSATQETPCLLKNQEVHYHAITPPVSTFHNEQWKTGLKDFRFPQQWLWTIFLSDVTPCTATDKYQCFREACFPHHRHHHLSWFLCNISDATSNKVTEKQIQMGEIKLTKPTIQSYQIIHLWISKH